MYDVDVYTHSTLQFMYMYNARLFLLFPSNLIVGNRTGVADYKIGQEANSKQSDVQVSLSTNMETDRQTDRQAGRQAGRQADPTTVTLAVHAHRLIYPSLWSATGEPPISCMFLVPSIHIICVSIACAFLRIRAHIALRVLHFLVHSLLHALFACMHAALLISMLFGTSIPTSFNILVKMRLH